MAKKVPAKKKPAKKKPTLEDAMMMKFKNEMAISDIIVRVSSNSVTSHCRFCHTKVKGHDEFEDVCNHLLSVHDLKCVHIGQETIDDQDGKPWQTTVAFFGI